MVIRKRGQAESYKLIKIKEELVSNAIIDTCMDWTVNRLSKKLNISEEECWKKLGFMGGQSDLKMWDEFENVRKEMLEEDKRILSEV